MLKAKVLQHIRDSTRFGSRPLVASEYCIGSTGVRADLVVASRTSREITAFEIKSENDTLKRLPHQLEAYLRYFDRVIVVAAHRHQKRVRQIRHEGLEIWEAEKSGSLAVIREGCAAGRKESLVDLLTQRDRGRYQGLIAKGPDGARDAFFATFDERFGPSSRLFWAATGRRIPPESVGMLSRFEADRDEERRRAISEVQQLSSWAALEAA